MKTETIQQVVVVVDDSSVNLLTATQMLKRQGFEVLTAANGFDAVNLVKNTSPAPTLVLMDYQMPIMNGAEATKHIKEYNPNIPVVGLTTENDANILHEFEQSGLSEFCTKPLKMENMTKITRKYSK